MNNKANNENPRIFKLFSTEKNKPRVTKWYWFNILFLLLALQFVSAETYQQRALILKGNISLESVYNIDDWVEHNITYKKNVNSVDSLDKLWKTRIGDCSEKARLKIAMLKSLNISARPARTTINGERHDLFEFCLTCNKTRFINGWQSIEQRWFNQELSVSRGFW